MYTSKHSILAICEDDIWACICLETGMAAQSKSLLKAVELLLDCWAAQVVRDRKVGIETRLYPAPSAYCESWLTAHPVNILFNTPHFFATCGVVRVEIRIADKPSELNNIPYFGQAENTA